MGDRILAVEDSPTQALELKGHLERAGYEVRLAVSGEEALELAAREAPDLVVSDIVMPGMDGYEVARRLRDLPGLEWVPVILLTQLHQPDDVIKGLECGANGFVIKPYDPEFLLHQIRFQITNAQRRRHQRSDVEIEIEIRGRAYRISTDRLQILDMLLATFDHLLLKHRELEEKNRELERALSEIKTLRGLVPICMGCKKIRNDQGYWEQLEVYISQHTEAEFSHGLCPDCRERLYPRKKKAE